MEIVCKHDPSDPDHLICEAKHSHFYEWLRKRWRQFYCKGPSCPVHKAYTHLVVDIVLLMIVLGLVISTLVFFFGGRGVDEDRVRPDDVFQHLPPVTTPDIIEEEEEGLFYLDAQALYYSTEGEQLGRGPWPLEFGKTTKLKVFWKINKGLVSSIVVSGKLGPNVQWTGFAPIGKGLLYEPATGNVQWIVGDGNTAVFEIAITPTEKGRIVVVDNLKIQGKHIKTGEIKQILVPDVIVREQEVSTSFI